MTLPEERVPFPVAPRYRIRPDMRRWEEGDRGHVRLDGRYPVYLREKLRLLATDPLGCRVPAPGADPGELIGALQRVAEGLADDAAAGGGSPAAVQVDADSVRFPLLGVALDRGDLGLVPLRAGGAAAPPALTARVRAHLAEQPALERLADALALAIQEDLVVMRLRTSAGQDAEAAERRHAPGPTPAGRTAARGGGAQLPVEAPDQAELLHVCFPSAWDPAARAGAGFAALHAPVPHGEVLRRAAPQVVRAMVSKGPFVRYVWSLTPDGRLDRNPRRQADLHAVEPPERTWFRVERQTVMPLPELARALFTIRVYMTPLARVITSAQRARMLASAVASMDAELRAYKGIGQARDELLAWLRERGATGY